MPTFETQSLDRLCAIANAYHVNSNILNPLFLFRPAQKGYTRYADNENLDAVIEGLTPTTQAIMSVWLKETSRENLMLHPFKANGELLVYIPKDTSFNMNATWDIVNDFIDQLTFPDNYDESTGSLTRCRLIKAVFHTIRTVDSNGVAIFDLGAYGNGSIEFGPIS